MKNIYIADDQAVTREGLTRILNRINDITVIGGEDKLSKTDVLEDLEKLKKANSRIDLIVLDVQWKGDAEAGFYIANWVRQQLPKTKILVISNYPDLVRLARHEDVDNVLHKDFTTEDFVREIRLTLGGEITLKVKGADYDLTETEKKILGKLDRTDKEIGKELGIKLFTVKKHVANILEKLGVDNRTKAILKAKDEGLLKPQN